MPSSSSSPALPDLTPRDESLILALLDADMSIAAVSRSEQTTLTALLRWSWQPHIRAWIAVLADLGSLRAKALAANHTAAAVRTLLSATHLADADFYEQADPADRIRSFESGRKAAAQLLRLAGCHGPAPGCHGSSGSAANRAHINAATSTPSRPRPAPAARRGRGPSESKPRPERGGPVSELGAQGQPDAPKPDMASNRAATLPFPRGRAARPGRLTFDGRRIPRRKRRRASMRTLARRAASSHRTNPPCPPPQTPATPASSPAVRRSSGREWTTDSVLSGHSATRDTQICPGSNHIFPSQGLTQAARSAILPPSGVPAAQAGERDFDNSARSV